MKVPALLVLATLFTQFSFAYVKIGNAGEGISFANDNKVYLRDLAEFNSHLDPQIGTNINTELKKIWTSSSLSRTFKEDELTILKKLSDLESIAPSLGFATLEALRLYSIYFVPHLDLLPSEQKAIPNAQRVQLATRTHLAIAFAKDGWIKMDSASKAALLIHEGLYSLVKLRCFRDGCLQISADIRPFVGELFAKTKNPNFYERLTSILSTGPKNPTDVCSRWSSLEMTVWEWSRYDGSPNITPEAKDFISRSYPSIDSSSAKKDVDLICEKARQISNGQATIEVNVVQPRLFTESSSYEIPGPIDDFKSQTRLTLSDVLFSQKFYIDFKDKTSCKKEVTTRMENLSNNNISQFINPKRFCHY